MFHSNRRDTGLKDIGDDDTAIMKGGREYESNGGSVWRVSSFGLIWGG